MSCEEGMFLFTPLFISDHVRRKVNNYQWKRGKLRREIVLRPSVKTMEKQTVFRVIEECPISHILTV